MGDRRRVLISSEEEDDDLSDMNRSRSFHEDPVDDAPCSPISTKLMAKNDVASKQKLRERLLKRNMMKRKSDTARRRDGESPFASRMSDDEDDDREPFVISDDSESASDKGDDDVFSDNQDDSSVIEPESDEDTNSSVVAESDEDDENSVAVVSDKEDEPAHNKSESIICLSSEDEVDQKTKAEKDPEVKIQQSDVNKENKSSKLPDHLAKFANDSLEDLDMKRARIESLIRNEDKLQLNDGGIKIRRALEDINQAIDWKKTHSSEDKERRDGGSGPKDSTNAADVHHQRRPPIVPPPQFDPATYSRLLSHDKKRLFGGKMTDNRLDAIKSATERSLQGMHNAVTNMPGEDTTLETPKGLRTELMSHQKQGLAWMTWRETQAAPGGILADDMGLGKTLSTIALVLHQKNERLKRKEEGNDEDDKKRREVAKKMGLVPSNCTLVVAPASVIYQWNAEIEKRVKTDRLSVYIFHGPKNRRESDPRRLGRYDIVITTYQLLATEMTEKIRTQNKDDDFSDDSEDERDDGGDQAAVAKGIKKRVMKSDSVLAQIAFERIILDEAHQIKNKTTGAAKGACSLSGRNHWCLTGTPIHNNLWDLFSLIRFIRVSPFDDDTHWKEYIMGSSQKCADRLNILTKSLLLRRTKAQTCAVTNKPLVDLKPKEYKQHDLNLDGLEGEIYDIMFRATQEKVKQMLSEAAMNDYEKQFGYRRRKKNADKDEPVINPFLIGQNKMSANSNFNAMSGMLVMLLRLRQACVHMSLTKTAVDLDAFEHLGGDEDDADEFLERTMAEMTLLDDAKPDALTVEKIFEKSFLSTKLKKTLEIIDEVVAAGDKIVVVSQWTSLLSIVEEHMKLRTVRYTVISGQVVPADRQERVDSFNKEGKGAKVMLLSLTAGGVGLNLIGGNHLIMVDLHWNPALEAQACDRIYRMGQKKTVHIHRLITTGTIEQRVVELQQKKLQLAGQVLDGAASKKMNKLTLQDMRYLFDLDANNKAKKGQSAQ